jgi:hypothetical protein
MNPTEKTREYNLASEAYYCYLEYSKSRNKYKITHTLSMVEDWVYVKKPYQKCLDKQIELETI